MPDCKNCNARLRWSQILRANLSYGITECNKCGSKHQISFKSRFVVYLMTTFPFLIYGFFLTPFTNVFLTLITGFVIACVGFLLSPFVVKFEMRSEL
ncbi:TIGR04104 family putative zinc finger protein [Alkalihalobacterium elongatum]|uniref:TIGR04104 family putative zinc finger protein n=1 Tax=Alkalihalobacterium elongatum TaxID=2675466 RepID=UPI001C1F342A